MKDHINEFSAINGLEYHKEKGARELSMIHVIEGHTGPKSWGIVQAGAVGKGSPKGW